MAFPQDSTHHLFQIIVAALSTWDCLLSNTLPSLLVSAGLKERWAER